MSIDAPSVAIPTATAEAETDPGHPLVDQILQRVDHDLRQASPATGEVLRLLRQRATRAELQPGHLAAALGFDAESRLTAFADELGLPAELYLLHLRLEIAAALLVETELPINQVARMSGFEEPANFRNSFHRHLHIPPGELRQAARRARDDPTSPPPPAVPLEASELRRLARRLAEELWNLLSSLPHGVRRELLRDGGLQVGSRELVDLLLARSHQLEPQDPQAARELAELALDCVAGSGELLALEARELRQLAERRHRQAGRALTEG